MEKFPEEWNERVPNDYFEIFGKPPLAFCSAIDILIMTFLLGLRRRCIFVQKFRRCPKSSTFSKLAIFGLSKLASNCNVLGRHGRIFQDRYPHTL